MKKLYLKQGDTLDVNCQAKDDAGDPQDITGWSVACAVRSAPFGSLQPAFTDDVTVTVTGAATGLFTLTKPAADTALWPLTVVTQRDGLPRQMFADIQFTSGSVVASTDTFEIVVIEDYA